MIAKIVAFILTGSAAMLSEALHSLADTLNQILLMIGIKRSTRAADLSFPFGYGAERAAWALMSAVGIFFLGCGVTVYHGVLSFLHPHPLGGLGIAVVVLIVSFVMEGVVLAVAIHAVRREAEGKPFLDYLRHEADPTAVAVVLEDSAACLGVVIALAGILMARLTGQSRWDALASILIGLLLGVIAVWLVARSRALLVGPAVPKRVRQQICEIISANPVVEKIVRLRTRVMDTETYRVAAEIDFAGEKLAEAMEDDLRRYYREIESWEQFRSFAATFADEIVEQLGDEIDAIEDAIQQEVPKARYLDLEAE